MGGGTRRVGVVGCSGGDGEVFPSISFIDHRMEKLIVIVPLLQTSIYMYVHVLCTFHVHACTCTCICIHVQ